MSFKNYLKKKIKYLLGIAGIAALLSQLILPVLSTKADGPRFNFLAGDYELIEGYNSTKSETVWKNPITGTAGDEFRGSVYYHNGMLNTTAANTRIKVNIPANTSGKRAKVTASISADNAETVTSTIVDGQLVGLDGLAANLDRDAELEFVPGSVLWFPNSSTNNPSVIPTPLPGGQSGNEIVSGGGVNIGDIQGCWQFAGFVTFKFKTKVKEAPAFTIDKTVRNVTLGGVSFAKETLANIGDETEFNIDVTNTGNVLASDGVIRDITPAGLEFVSGSFKKIAGGVATALPDSESAKFFGAGITIDNLAPGSMISYLFTIKVTSLLKAGDSATNTASATVFALAKQSSAKVTVATTPAPNIVKSKSAFNNTKNKPTGETKNNVGDNITYTLNTSNTGDAPIDYEIKDDIAEVLSNASIVSISNNGQVVGSEIKWPSVTINTGEKIVRSFQVKVKNVANGTRFRNVYGNGVVVVIDVPVILNPILHIEKLVRDVTTGENNFVKSNQAFAGDTLEYLINYSNTGNGPADGVKISDVLPANTQYVAGTTRISWDGKAEQTLTDGIVGSGITLATIPVGEVGYIKLRVVISGSIAAGENLVNTATVNNLSDTASTKIIAKAVIPATTTPLPKTGATGAASFMIALLAGIWVLYYKYRKLMNSESTMIINSMLA